jgi:5-methylcytosine-specific restriction endonuclease McrA
MKLSEGDELDDALELFHNHSWVEQKPVISAEQMAELVPVLAPLWQRSRAKVRAERPKQKVQGRARPTRDRDGVTSSEIPQRIRDAVLDRDGYACTHCGIPIDRLHYSLHHRRPRGMGGSRRLHTMANLVTLCGSGVDGCHGAVERDRPTSRRTGWLVPNGQVPEKWPVLRRTADGVGWWQPGERWVPAEPHPDQTDDEGKVA